MSLPSVRVHTWRKELFLAAALIIAGAAALPLVAQPGLLNTRGGGDSPFLLQRLHQLATAIGDGHFPVRWMPDANYGYGYPFFHYYAPFSIYIAAIFRFIGFSYVRAIQLAQLLGFITAAWGMFCLAGRWLGSRWAALLAAAAYTLAPFHLVNIYVRGDSLAEFWAMAFYPWTIVAADDVACRSDRRAAAVARFGLAYAALILSHNISALIFTPFLLFYILLRSSLARYTGTDQGGGQKGSLMPLLAGILLALALAAWFFLPALGEQSLAQLAPVTRGYFHYSNHFLGADLVQPGILFDYTVEGKNTFRLGLVQAVTTSFGLGALLLYHRKHRASAFILTTCLGATFMLTPLSRFLWDHLPLLPFAQFPWRFLSVQAFAGALAAGTLARLPAQRFIVPGIILLLLVSGLGGLRVDHLALTDADVTAERLAQYEWFTGNIGTTISAEYLPHTVQPRPYTSPWLRDGERWQVQVGAGDLLSAHLSDQATGRQVWQVQAAADGAMLTFPTLYWPGWEAAIDGVDTEIWPAAGSGLITLEVPPGVHIITLRLGRTPGRLAAELISLTALALTVWLLRPQGLPRLQRRHLYGLLLIAFTLIGVRIWPEHPLPHANLTWDFAQMGYLHHDTAGVAFSDGSRLVEYSYSSDRVAAGETLTITLTMQIGQTEEATLALATPAVNRFEEGPLWLSQTLLLAERVVYTFAIPADTPAGLVVPRLTLGSARPLMPSGQTRGDLFLRPLRIASSGEPAAGEQAPLDVRATGVRLRDETTLDVQLAWLTTSPLSHNYNVSLRLVDDDGVEVAQFDTQPGFGFQPSSGWPAGHWVNDWLALPLPADLSDNSAAALVVRLYEVETGRVTLTRRLGEVTRRQNELLFQPNQPTFSLPAQVEPATAIFSDGTAPLIQLRGYRLDQVADTLHLTLYWEALAAGQKDYTRFVHLIDPATEDVLRQNDALPRHNSYPTSQWVPGEIVSDSISLSLAGAAPGSYRLALGFYHLEGSISVRLRATDGDARPLPADRVLLPEAIETGP